MNGRASYLWQDTGTLGEVGLGDMLLVGSCEQRKYLEDTAGCGNIMRSEVRAVGNHLSDFRVMDLLGYPFLWTARIEPERDSRGEPLEFLPQCCYAEAATSRLHPHGGGPFCRIKLDDLPASSCVYAITLEDNLVYLGAAGSLADRWGSSQYGKIQPRNCYVGGQTTNCRINNLLLLEARRRSLVELWRYETPERKQVESVLIDALNPPWNIRK